jgi:serine/threonine protein kinase
MLYTGRKGSQYNLSVTPFATGGEGEIYNVVGNSRIVAKIYKSGKADTAREHKLIKMLNFPPNKNVLSQIAWVKDILYKNGRFVGFVMPKLPINEDLNVIYEYGASAKYFNMPWESKITIAENLCAVLDSIHDAGHVCGDLNPKNISVDPKTGYVVFLDTDSYHIRDGGNTYRCNVGIPEYLPVEVQSKMRGVKTLATANLPTFSEESDNFALAIHIFQLLMNGAHPFSCAITPNRQSSVVAPQPNDNIMQGSFPFMNHVSGIKIPVYAPSITILPQNTQNLFRRAFIDGHKNPSLRPNPEEWHSALRELKQDLLTCNRISHHQYYSSQSDCPWCAIDKGFSNQSKPRLSQTLIVPSIPSVQPPTYKTPPSSNSTTNSTYKPITKKRSSGAIIAIIVVLLCIAVLGIAMLNSWQTQTLVTEREFNTGVYSGEWARGSPNGNGIWRGDGRTYEGFFVNGHLNGEGQITWVDGNWFKGNLVMGERTEGTFMRISDGSMYEGTFLNGEPWNGKTTHANGGFTVFINGVIIDEGNVIQFGDYNWKVLDVQDGRALIITDRVIERRVYHNAETSITWADSDLRQYLNDAFLNTFSEEDRARIITTTNTNPDNPWFGTHGGVDTLDDIFLLSLEEIVKYYGDSGRLSEGLVDDWWFSDQYDEVRIAFDMQGVPLWWWLRSSGTFGGNAARIFNEGYISVGGLGATDYGGGGVRPALWLEIF